MILLYQDRLICPLRINDESETNLAKKDKCHLNACMWFMADEKECAVKVIAKHLTGEKSERPSVKPVTRAKR